MSQIVKQLVFLLIVCAFVGTGLIFILKNFYTDNQTLTLTDTVEIAAIKNRDDSARITEGTFLINQEGFETEVSNQIRNHPSFDDDNIQIDFDYLRDHINYGIKGIRVSVFANGDYQQATYWVSTPTN